MTNIDLDQIVPPDMPEWFYQEDSDEWKFKIKMSDAEHHFTLALLKPGHPIRYLAGCVMMAYWQEKRYVCYIQPDESTEVGNKYDAAREWRDGNGSER